MQDREKQFKELFLSEYGRMYKAACILLGDEDEAKDVVQDVFAKLWAGTITLREETQRAFLLTCVRNRCLNIIAHHQAFRTVPTDDKAIGTEMADAKASRTTDEELVETINRYVDEKLTPQTSRIIMNAHRINKGLMPDLSNGKDTDFFFIEQEDPEVAAAEIMELVKSRLPKHYRIPSSAIQVLAPMQRGVVGAVNLNQMLQNALNPVGDGLKKRRISVQST